MIPVNGIFKIETTHSTLAVTDNHINGNLAIEDCTVHGKFRISYPNGKRTHAYLGTGGYLGDRLDNIKL